MTIVGFLQWLANTSFSTAIHDSIWAEPLFEGTHVLALTMFFGFTVMLDLRLLGILYKRRSASQVLAQLNPWCVRGFAIMIVSGVLLFCTDPVDFYATLAFKIKMGLLVLAGINIWVFNSTVGRSVGEWNHGKTPARAKVAAIGSLVLWIGIIGAGRLIAYMITLS